jgi:cbb3-type cytochrome oxidase subunit 1
MGNRIDLQFLLLGTVMLIAGVTLGIVMGVREDFQLVPVHAHINLVGWVSLMLFGLVYRAYPELAQRKLARLHLLLAACAAVLFPIGIALAVLRASHGLAIFASLLWLVGCIVFLLQLLSLIRTTAPVAAVPAE